MTFSIRKSVDWGETGKAGTLAYTVVGPGGTHVARTTTGVAAGSVSGKRYYVDVTYDTAWDGASILWDDGTDEVPDSIDGRIVAAPVTKRFSVDWGATGKVGTLAYTVTGPGGTTLVSRTTSGVTAGGVSGKSYYVDLSVVPAWVGAEIVWDDTIDEVSEPISGGAVMDVNVTAWRGMTVNTTDASGNVKAVNDSGASLPTAADLNNVSSDLSTLIGVTGEVQTAIGTPDASLAEDIAAIPSAQAIAEAVGEAGGLSEEQDAKLTATHGQALLISSGGNTIRSPYQDGVLIIPKRMTWADTNIAALTIPQDSGNWPVLSQYQGSVTLHLSIETRYTNHATYSTNYASASFACTSSGSGTSQAILCRPTSTTNLMPTSPAKGFGGFPYKGQVWAGNILVWSGAVDVTEDIRS